MAEKPAMKKIPAAIKANTSLRTKTNMPKPIRNNPVKKLPLAIDLVVREKRFEWNRNIRNSL
jgi:hypothetical protein